MEASLATATATDDCCSQQHGSSSSMKQPGYVKHLELVCTLAFSAFSIMVAPERFVLFFAAGVVYECFRPALLGERSNAAGSRPGCGQGNGEILAGRGLHPVEIVAVTALLFFEHLEHHPEFFVPFVGAWVGVRTVVHIRAFFNHHSHSHQ